MRTTSPAQRASASNSRVAAYTIVEITDADGYWRDLSQAVQGTDWVNGGSIEESADGNSQRFNLTLQRDVQGFQLKSNPEFAGGSLVGYGVYDNSSTGNVTLASEADTGAPSGYRMKITVAAGTLPSPGLGGIATGLDVDSGVSAIQKYHKGSRVLWKILAFLPVGSTINFASNGYGVEGSLRWVTPQDGTGDWFEYRVEQTIGRTGSFASTGYFYLLPTTIPRPFSWYIRRITATDLTVSLMTSLVPLRTNTAANLKADGTYAPLLDLNRKWRVSTAIMRPDQLPSKSRTNSEIWSRDLTNGAYATVGTGTRTQNAIGLDGTSNSATTIADTDGAAVFTVLTPILTIPADAATHTISVAIKKDTDQTRFPLIYANMTGGTAVTAGLHLNTQTGDYVVTNFSGVKKLRVIDGDKVGPFFAGWWIVEIAITNNSTNTSYRAQIDAARSTTIGVDNLAATGSVIVGHVQIELNKSEWSDPVFTTTAAVTVSDYEEAGNGFYDTLAVKDSPAVIQIAGRDSGAVLLDGYIRIKRTYGTAGGVSLESALQSMIDDNATDNNYSSLTLFVPVPSGIIVNSWEQSPGNLMQALNAAAQKFGFVVRFRYDASDVLRLTLWKPNRTATVEDFVLGPAEYLNIPINKLDKSGVRTVAEVRFFDAASGTIHTIKSPNPETSASITKYGKIYIGFDVSSSGPVNSDAKAQIYVDAVRADLETPALEQQIESYGLWWVQLGDYIKMLANDTHYDTAQFGGVMAFTHTFGAGTWRTVINLKGKPAGRYATWLSQGTTDVGGTEGATPSPLGAPIIAVTRSFVTPPTVSQESVLVTGGLGIGGSVYQWRYRVIQENTVAPAWGVFSTVPALPVEITVTRGLKWKRTIEVQATDASGQISQDAYDIASKMDALDVNGIIDDTVNMSHGAAPFKRGLDTATDVIITSVRTFVDPSAATQVDALGRIVGVYRLGVYEPVNNLVKVGDALGATTVSSLTVNGTGMNRISLTGSPTTGIQIAFGTSSVWTAIGTINSSGNSFIAYNASQPTVSTDSWQQNLGSLPSVLIELTIGGRFGFYGAVAGKATAARATFWGSYPLVQFTEVGWVYSQAIYAIQRAGVDKTYLWSSQGTDNGINGSLIDDFMIRTQATGARILFSTDAGSTIGALVGSGGSLNTKGQLRATGWFASGDMTGLGAELGVSSGLVYLIAFNRSTSAYAPLQLSGSVINLIPTGGANTVYIDDGSNTKRQVACIIISSSAPTTETAPDGTIWIRT